MKKLKIFLPILLISLFFIPKVNASVYTNNGKFPDISTDAKSYMISYYGNNNNFYLAYCKNDDEVLIPINEALSQGPYAIGYCYNKTTKRSTGNAYRRNFVATGMSANDILSKNVTDFSSFSWGAEQQGTWYTSTVMYKYNNLNRLVIVDDYTNYNNMASTWGYVFYINENIYNNWGNGTTLTDNLIILNKDLFSTYNPNPYACSISSDFTAGGGFRDSLLSNISDFSYNITATGLSSQDYCIQSSFAISSTSVLLQSGDTFDLDIIKGPNSSGDYNVNGNFILSDDSKSLIVSYNVCATGSTPANVDAIIKVTPVSSNAKDFFNSKLIVNYCIPEDNEQTQDLNIGGGYAYTDNTTGLTNSYDTSLMNFLNNNSNPNLSFFSNMNTVLPTGPVDRVLTLPLTMLNSISNAMGDTCNPITFTIPYLNEDITIPCMNTFYDNIGATGLFNVIGGIASVLILGEYFIFLYNWVDNTLRFSEHRLRMWGASVR